MIIIFVVKFQIFTVALLLATATIEASFPAAAPLALPAPISYTRAIPYNIPPFAASVNTFAKTALAAPAAVLPAPLGYAAAPAAPLIPAPLAAAPAAPFLPAPLAAAPAAPLLPAPAFAARSIHPYAPAFRAAFSAPLLGPSW